MDNKFIQKRTKRIKKIQSLIKKSEKNSGKLIKISKNDNLNETIIEILSKEERTEEEINIIKTYLKSLKKFMELLSKYNEEDIDFFLTKIANELKIEKQKKNNFLMKIGDTGNKFYIILYGKVLVLIPKHFQVLMTKKDYITHLKLLKFLGENYLFENTLMINYSILPLSIEDIEKEKKKETINIEEFTLKDFFSLINGEKFQDDEKIDSLFKLNKKEIDNILNPNEELNSKYYLLNILGLIKVVELNKGNYFGEIALLNEDSKRTASIFCLEDCYFGILTSNQYKLYIKNCQDIIKENNINVIMETKLFNHVGRNLFKNKFLNLFVERQLYKGEYIFKKNFEREEIYFIFEGEIKIILPKLTYDKINIYLSELSDYNNVEKKNITIKKECDITLSYVKKGEIIGMNDLLYNDKFYCNGIVESQQVIIFAINYNFLLIIFDNYEKIKENWKKIQNKKIKIMISRLNSIKRTFESDLIENIRREVNNAKYDNGQKITNFFENMGNVVIPGSQNKLKIKINQEKFDLNPLNDKNLVFNHSNRFIRKKNNFIQIKENQINNNHTIDYNCKLPKINMSNSFLKKKIFDSKYTQTDNFKKNDSDSNDLEVKTIEKNLFKKKYSKIKISKNQNLKTISFEKSNNKTEISKGNESERFLNSLSKSQNKISLLNIKEFQRNKLMKKLCFIDDDINYYLKENLGVSFNKSLSSQKKKHINKIEKKKQIKPPFSYIRMGMTLQNNKFKD